MLDLTIQSVHRFIYETGHLRFETRHGWLRLLRQHDNVAEHTFRAAVIAYILALMEEHNHPDEAVTMVVFHDIHEVRIGDTDPYQKRYLIIDDEKAVRDQLSNLSFVGEKIYCMWSQMHEQKTCSARIAKDADLLECAYSASELIWQGLSEAREWLPPLEARLNTASAKKLFTSLLDVSPSRWWQEIGVLPSKQNLQ